MNIGRPLWRKIAHLCVAFSLFCNYLYRVSPITSSDKLWFMTDRRTLLELLSEFPVWVLQLCLVSLHKMSLCNVSCVLNPKCLNFLMYVLNCTTVSSWEYNSSDIFKTPELIPSARQFPSPFKSLPQWGSSCRKDLTFPRIVPAVNDRFRKEAREWQKKKKNHPFDTRHDKWIDRKKKLSTQKIGFSRVSCHTNNDQSGGC